MSESYKAFLQTDDAWHDELRRIFGKRNAASMRYVKAGRGDPGSNLRVLHDARERAREKWDATRSALLRG